eukprot:PITA_03760
MAFHNLRPSVSLPVILTVVGRGAATAAILCTFFSFFFIICLLQKRWSSVRYPPGPYPWPVVGNLHQLRLPAHRFFKGLADKYGPILFLRLGSVPTVVVSSSEIAKHFLKTHDLIFASRPQRASGRLMFFNFKDVIFAPYGDHWRQMRRMCVLELLTAKRIESFKNVREEEVSAMIRSICKESESGRMGVNVSKAVTTLTSNIVWRMLVKRKFSDDDLGGDFKGFKELLIELAATVGEFYIGDFIPCLDWLDLQGTKRRMKKIDKTFNEFAEKIIDDHVNVNHLMARASNGQKEGEAGPHVQDFVDVLLHLAETDTKITRETIKAVVLDMFGAGAETTSTILEWGISELLRHPNVMKKLYEEIESVVGQHGNVKESNLETMRYLHSVVKETLRLYPPAPLSIPHESVEAVTVGGYYIPNKTMVMVSLWAIGRDPNVWGPDASEFRPERFMEDQYINLTDQSDFSMIPFGAGRRGCPGASLAIPTIELALAQLMYTFDWRVEGDPSKLDMTEACGVTIPRQVPLCAYPTLRISSPP